MTHGLRVVDTTGDGVADSVVMPISSLNRQQQLQQQLQRLQRAPGLVIPTATMTPPIAHAAAAQVPGSIQPTALGVPTAQEEEDFKTWPAMWQRMAFYAKVWNPRTGFTLKGPEIAEYKALIQQGIDLEQARIEQGGLPKALTLKYLRELLGNSE